MPSKSEKQRKLMGAALAKKRGKSKTKSKKVAKVAKSMSEGDLKDFASKKKEADEKDYGKFRFSRKPHVNYRSG